MNQSTCSTTMHSPTFCSDLVRCLAWRTDGSRKFLSSCWKEKAKQVEGENLVDWEGLSNKKLQLYEQYGQRRQTRHWKAKLDSPVRKVDLALWTPRPEGSIISVQAWYPANSKSKKSSSYSFSGSERESITPKRLTEGLCHWQYQIAEQGQE